MNLEHLNPVQKAAVQLMRNDLTFLYTILMNKDQLSETYFIEFFPYMGLIIHGIENWIVSYNNSSKNKITIPVFNQEEKEFYTELRLATKMLDTDYSVLYALLKAKYKESEEHFANVCKPLAKKLHLYDIYGTYIGERHFCGNTILDACYVPRFSWQQDQGEFIKRVSEIGGAYICIFGLVSENDTYHIVSDWKSYVKDYGGFIKSPVGNRFSWKFVLFSMLCQINFIVYGMDKMIEDNVCTTEIRMAYLLYYYLTHIIEKMNSACGLKISLDGKWENTEFRNAMAHYKLGVALKKGELDEEDPLYGLTGKYFNCSYSELKNSIISELENTSLQMEKILNINLK